MKLSEMADLLMVKETSGDLNVEIHGISMNSKKVAKGDLFVCIPGIPGFQEDRHAYAQDAAQAGAAALLVEREVDVQVPTIQVPDARYAMAVIAAHLHGYPSERLKLIGVTGTNGKTTTCHMLESILAEAGFRTGMMGNLGTKIGSVWLESDINTQEPPSLQANLKRMADASVDYCVMEASSQGLAFGRVLGCRFRTAIFTNLTQDHLDYHQTMERYREAKGLLFARLGNAFSADPAERAYAILNADDPASEEFKRITAAQVVTYGRQKEADVKARDIQLSSRGTTFAVDSFNGSFAVTLNQIGAFNVDNALAAIAAALVNGVPVESIQAGLLKMESVRGRMEVVFEGQPFLVLVDFAHTPDGLEKALSTIGDLAEGRIITVFGCGGNRDKTKRPIMGAIAAERSDLVIATSDNPRFEDPALILRDIEEGFLQKGYHSYELLPDREEAIQRAIALAQPGDVVIFAGKGHETYQVVGDQTLPFHEVEIVRKALLAART
ncbi:UDP-N-acetylmuramoyl-L-alanyl-D-glutamate--2,6-diaminopimelate ligase [Gorillibacterium sp. CAU 1737]|uniref:UDP-N-acetylmuramoyl-L-alanyl-D-glutamate--2, 6-diaminopimelate ligase n=1 Tax=Gorillibacterium sp. CAU 1737 TaxID=3140362 RepID=UPI003260920A